MVRDRGRGRGRVRVGVSVRVRVRAALRRAVSVARVCLVSSRPSACGRPQSCTAPRYLLRCIMSSRPTGRRCVRRLRAVVGQRRLYHEEARSVNTPQTTRCAESALGSSRRCGSIAVCAQNARRRCERAANARTSRSAARPAGFACILRIGAGLWSFCKTSHAFIITLKNIKTPPTPKELYVYVKV